MRQNIDNTAFLKQNAQLLIPEITDENEECLIELVDCLSSHFIKSSKVEYVGLIDLISQNSDGSLSEHLGVKLELIFRNNFSHFAKYTFENEPSQMISFLTNELGMNISILPKDSWNDEKDKLKQFVKRECKLHNAKPAMQACFFNIINSINPEDYE
ncbi:hypothetical protein EYV94_18460 [Puteibacter caeruleilacunae]|nr:hypothetical protein EYV94_18460 [Puteibacter caeruleilacunae]